MSQSIFGSLLGTNAAQQQGLGQQGLMGAAQGLGLSAQQQQYMTQQQYASVQQMYANQVRPPELWPKVNPFLPFDREFARLELTKILLNHGDGKFNVSYGDISRHTEVGDAVNGLHALGLVSVEVTPQFAQFECQITERGLMIVKEET